jgi:hypothetical protein
MEYHQQHTQNSGTEITLKRKVMYSNGASLAEYAYCGNTGCLILSEPAPNAHVHI